MKKIFLIITCILGYFLNSSAQISTCFRLNGVWGDWKEATYTFKVSGTVKNGYLYSNQPYDFQLHWTIDNYTSPSKKLKKQYKKEKKWFKYTGWVEYFVNENYPTIESLIRRNYIELWPSGNDSGSVKRRAKAEIWVDPDYKEIPRVINLFFDGVGVGVILYQNRSIWGW